MKGVILASGLGRRMGGFPKGLVNVGGRPILYRTIRLLMEMGVDEFFLVVNPRYEEHYRRFVEENFSERGRFHFIVNARPERENGYSLYLIRGVFEGRFVLTMSDHVYSRGFVKRAFEAYDGTPSAVIDKNPMYVDVEEATKVKCKEGRVVLAGKGLKEYTGLDTGFFFLSTELLNDVEGFVQERERVPLSDILPLMGIGCLEVSGEFWMDVDTPGEAKRATWFLIKDATKGRGDGWVSRIVNRHISRRITYFLVNRLTPDAATLISFSLGIFSSIVAYFSPPIGGILYQFHSIFDGVDGEIARVRMMESPAGGWMDSILDRVVDFSFLLSLALYIQPQVPFLPWVLLSIFGTLMVSYTSERFRGSFCRDAYSAIPQLSYFPGKRDERVFAIMLFSMGGWIKALFIFLAIFANLKVMWNFYWMLRWTKGREHAH